MRANLIAVVIALISLGAQPFIADRDTGTLVLWAALTIAALLVVTSSPVRNRTRRAPGPTAKAQSTDFSIAILGPKELTTVEPRARTVRSYVLPIKNAGGAAVTNVRVKVAKLGTVNDNYHLLGIERYQGAALRERISGRADPVTIPVGDTPTEFSLLTRTPQGVRIDCEPSGGEWGLPAKLFGNRYRLSLEVQGDLPSTPVNRCELEWWHEPDDLGNVNRFNIRRVPPAIDSSEVEEVNVTLAPSTGTGEDGVPDARITVRTGAIGGRFSVRGRIVGYANDPNFVPTADFTLPWADVIGEFKEIRPHDERSVRVAYSYDNHLERLVYLYLLAATNSYAGGPKTFHDVRWDPLDATPETLPSYQLEVRVYLEGTANKPKTETFVVGLASQRGPARVTRMTSKE